MKKLNIVTLIATLASIRVIMDMNIHELSLLDGGVLVTAAAMWGLMICKKVRDKNE